MTTNKYLEYSKEIKVRKQTKMLNKIDLFYRYCSWQSVNFEKTCQIYTAHNRIIFYWITHGILSYENKIWQKRKADRRIFKIRTKI